ncbi:MAG TPA: enolase C-terminal domain-like protein [Verrucomicrobiales bacterium]|nr:enolase C-terminal domain-like protein [Verrucomicrobiales bacterium]
MSPIYIWRYRLRSVAGLNARSTGKEHPGVLIRKNGGFACLHPWPELGDAVIDEQLRALASDRVTPLITQALRCTEEDGRARREGRSLFAGPVPESHWLALPGDDPAEALSLGFKRVKVKIGRDLAEEIRVAGEWGRAGFQLRFDANESLSSAMFREFWDSLGDLRDHVELVEDPIPWSPESWQLLRDAGVPLAVDREVEVRFQGRDYAVIKPALSNWIPPRPSSFLVTSYMDHALGQAWAAAEASRLAASPDGFRMKDCGLLTHRCFESDSFFERIRSDGARLLAPEGNGLGFDELLEGLPWKRLI